MIIRRFFLLTLSLVISGCYVFGQQKVWLDTDTGNEMDDLYALVRLVLDPDIHVTGISSAHFNNPDLLVFDKWNAYDSKTLNTVKESQRLNEELISAMQITDISLPQGADRQIGRAWGQQDPRDSPAVRELIQQVKTLEDDEYLDVLTLGALTNIASAVIIAPEILPRIRVFSLGARYNPRTQAWNKNEFNIRNDLNAFDYLLNLEGFDFTVMPLDAAFPLQFDREITYEELDETIPVEKILADRWRIHNPQDKKRIMWDLALVEAYLNPGFAEIVVANTPPENTAGTVKVYTRIDENKLTADFWMTLRANRN